MASSCQPIPHGGYRLVDVNVPSPDPASGLQLWQCDSSRVFFRSRVQEHGRVETIGAFVGPFTSPMNDTDFKSWVEAVVEGGAIEVRGVVVSVVATVTSEPSRQCAEIVGVGTAGKPPLSIRGRACKSASGDSLYWTLHTFRGTVLAEEDEPFVRKLRAAMVPN